MAGSGTSGQHSFDIRPLSKTGAEKLSAGMARIDPWVRLGITKAQLFSAMTRADGITIGLEAMAGQTPIGLMTYAPGWLFGPYIKLLAVLPGGQGQGLGTALIERIVGETRQLGQANVWVCASAFNAAALAFYESRGFRRVGVLDGLVVADEDEILLRRRL